MIKNRSAAPGPVVPTLVYEDVGQAIDWLCETFGFAKRQYTAEDLGSHRWTFTQSVADVAPEEWGGRPARSR
jgi:hypothetical protein